MLRSGHCRALGSLAIVPLALAACGGELAAPPSATAVPDATVDTTTPIRALPLTSPTATPRTPRPERLDAAQLVERITSSQLASHLAALQAMADAHGGDRATGSAGFEAASAYVVGVLEAVGYRVDRRVFEMDGVAGTNLIVERPGSSDEVVMLGAHLDTVAGSPGLNDDGSGVAAVLAVAEALAELPPLYHTIRLALWDAEEGGPFGSSAYVASLNDEARSRIRAYLNLDMIGSPNAVRFVYDEPAAAPGSSVITGRMVAVLEREGLAWEPIDLEGDSDHGPFTDAGIPTGGLFSGGIEPVTPAQAERHGATPGTPADPCSHRPCDTLGNVDPNVAAELARVAAAVLVELAAAP